jgi:hypothetical protein
VKNRIPNGVSNKNLPIKGSNVGGVRSNSNKQGSGSAIGGGMQMNEDFEEENIMYMN